MNLCPACGGRHQAPDFACPLCDYVPALGDGFPLLAPALASAVSGFDPQEFAGLAASEDGHFWFEARNRMIVDRFRATFADAIDYLEVGCGTGCVLAAISHAFPHLRITASEVLSAGLPYASRRVPHARLLQLDARALPFEAEFDVIGAFDVLEHIVEDEAVLRQFHRALRPGGGVIATVPQHPGLWSEQDTLARHERRYRRGELERKLAQAGFDIVYSSSFMSLLLPAMWLSRWRPRRGVAAQAEHEMAPPRWLNALFASAMAVERYAMRAGLRLPFGGSRLVVARRGPTP